MFVDLQVPTLGPCKLSSGSSSMGTMIQSTLLDSSSRTWSLKTYSPKPLLYALQTFVGSHICWLASYPWRVKWLQTCLLRFCDRKVGMPNSVTFLKMCVSLWLQKWIWKRHVCLEKTLEYMLKFDNHYRFNSQSNWDDLYEDPWCW